MIRTTTLILLFTLNLLQLVQNIYLVDYITNKNVWDIDAIRNTYSHNLYYFYFQGCKAGTERPLDADPKQESGFDVNSVTNYCYKRREEMSAEVLHEIANFQRKRR